MSFFLSGKEKLMVNIKKILSWCLALLLAACTMATPPTPTVILGSTIPTEPAPSPTLAQTPTQAVKLAKWDWILYTPFNPIHLKIDLDTSRSMEATIPPSGGKLAAVGADGTHYILDLPAGSVVMDTPIRMTPVKTVRSLPLKQGETGWAVQLEPEGLQLLARASLTIQFAEKPPVNQQVPFQYLADGQSFNLAAPVVNAAVDTGVDNQGIQLDISHFSGYGVAKGFLAELEPVRERLGGSLEDRINTEIARLLSIERQKQLLGSSDEGVLLIDSPTLRELLSQYHEKVLQPRIEAAQTSCAAGQLVLQTILQSERQRQLLGESGADTVIDQFNLPEGFALMVTRRCVQEEYEMCRDQHIITRMVPLLLGLQRKMELLGVTHYKLDPEILKMAQNCLTFELQFDSTGVSIHNYPQAEIHETVTVSAKIPLQYEPLNLLVMEGKGTLEVKEYVPQIIPSDFCHIVSKDSTNGQFTVTSLGILSQVTALDKNIPPVTGVNLFYALSGSQHKWSDQCIKNDVIYWAYTGSWGMPHKIAFGVLHEAESYPPVRPPMTASSFRAPQWTIGSGELIASLQWQKSGPDPSVKDNSYIESGTFKLYHRPK
jgi:hypothetical protein